MSKGEDILENFSPYELDFINKLISITQHDKDYFFFEAQKMYDYIYLFEKEFPHNVDFNNEIILLEEYIIDNLQKIYNQIQKIPTSVLTQNDSVKVNYYLYDSKSSKYWENKKVEIGKTDEHGILNTGCNLIYKYFYVSWRDFLIAYESVLN